jgi:hypothetical protein
MAAAIRRKHMKKIKAYETVVEKSAGYGNWVMEAYFKNLTPEERIEKICDVIPLAAQRGDDEKALDYFKLLQQAFLDIEIIPTLVEKEGVMVWEPSREQHEDVFVRANRACASKVMVLYPKIAGFKLNEFGKYIKDEERWGRGPNTAQLIETKKAMLQYVASLWRNTQSDAEANNYFLFLWAAYACVFFSDERNICAEEIRKATREGFSPVRLIRHRLLLTEPNLVFAQGDDERKALEKILMHAWVNNIDSRDAEKLFRATQPILELKKDICRYEDDEAPYALLEHVSEEIASLHKDVKGLIRSIKIVLGRIKISYLDHNHVKISLEVGIADHRYFIHQQKTPESLSHLWFERARDYILDWRERPENKHNYAVSLAVSVKWEWSKDLLFFREDVVIAK